MVRIEITGITGIKDADASEAFLMRRPRHPRDEFHVWLKDNPPLDLQALATQYGGYPNIPPKAWEYYDAALSSWEAKRKDRLLGSHTWEELQGMKKATPTKEQKARLKAKAKSTTAKEQNTDS